MTRLASNNGGLVDSKEIEGDIDINELCREASARAYTENIDENVAELADQAANYLDPDKDEDVEDVANKYSGHGNLAANTIYANKNF